jgi:hypothetical protein
MLRQFLLDQVNPLATGVVEVLDAVKIREILKAFQSYPDLLSEEGEALFASVVLFAQLKGFKLATPLLLDRQAWLRDLRDTGTTSQDIRIPDDR